MSTTSVFQCAMCHLVPEWYREKEPSRGKIASVSAQRRGDSDLGGVRVLRMEACIIGTNYAVRACLGGVGCGRGSRVS